MSLSLSYQVDDHQIDDKIDKIVLSSGSEPEDASFCTESVSKEFCRGLQIFFRDFIRVFTSSGGDDFPGVWDAAASLG